jgi:hypothetical protein
MAATKTKQGLPEATRTKIRACLLAGMGIRETARKFKVSPPTVLNIKRTLTNTEITLVEQGTAYKTGISEIRDEHPERAESIVEAVDQRTKDLDFFRRGSLLVAQVAIRKIQKESTDLPMSEIKSAADALGKAKENIFGKAPETAVQINQTNNASAPPGLEVHFIDPEENE